MLGGLEGEGEGEVLPLEGREAEEVAVVEVLDKFEGGGVASPRGKVLDDLIGLIGERYLREKHNKMLT